jgi:hypothetical protein
MASSKLLTIQVIFKARYYPHGLDIVDNWQRLAKN